MSCPTSLPLNCTISALPNYSPTIEHPSQSPSVFSINELTENQVSPPKKIRLIDPSSAQEGPFSFISVIVCTLSHYATFLST